MSTYDTATIQATDAVEDRPADCDCWDARQGLPCWPCYREGLRSPNPATPAAEND